MVSVAEQRFCDKCKSKISSRFCWHITSLYGNNGGVEGLDLCRDCIVKIFSVSINKVRFIEQVTEFRKDRKKNRYSSEAWSMEEVGIFASKCKMLGIPFADYGVPLYCVSKGGSYKYVYLHQLLGKSKVQADPDVVQEKIDSKVWDDLEKNHDKFLKLMGIDKDEE